ncbi:MAG: hypothetical protein HZC38_17680 [Chloroflexi bacterium]|nr:hypothetical protein [Chloroflexota bacterium]
MDNKIEVKSMDENLWLKVNETQLVSKRLLATEPKQRCEISECEARCCAGGVLISLSHKEKILAHAALIQPHLPEERRDPALWFDGVLVQDADFPDGVAEGTHVVDDPTHPASETCIFLRPQDRYCALQMTSIVNDQHPWSLKPFFCALHPVTLDNGCVILDENNVIYQNGGHCQRASVITKPLYETFDVELQLILGEADYNELLKRVS